MPHALRILSLALLAVAAFSAPLDAQKQKVKRDANRISQEEILASSAANGYELVRGVRSQWLRVRGQASLQMRETRDPVTGDPMKSMAPQEIVVYVDGMRYGNQEDLRNLATHDLATLEFLNPSSATQRFGTGHPYGAIVVTRRT